ncbi:MAG: hypothetical protein F4Y57_02015, partial [Acidobacteria bacterium]|nr:hypothetical protein [Acidobacteriota bacterium]
MMRTREIVTACGLAFVMALAVPAAGVAQSAESNWTAPRTADGHPDLQRVCAHNSASGRWSGVA